MRYLRIFGGVTHLLKVLLQWGLLREDGFASFATTSHSKFSRVVEQKMRESGQSMGCLY